MQRTVIIIGGGASGLAAAIAAARAGARVTVLEAGQRVGAKILRTGNGRCNLTNRIISSDGYNDPAFVAPVLGRWGSADIRDFFQGLGLLMHEDGSGRVFPLSDNANSVLDVLRFECAHLGVDVRCCEHVVDVGWRRDRDGRPIPVDGSSRFTVRTADGAEHGADAVILASGDDASLAGVCGLRRRKQRPVLCGLRCDRGPLKGLEGLRAQADITLLRGDEVIARESGEVIFKKEGVSGIPILNLSRVAEQDDVLSLDLMPGMSGDGLAAFLHRRAEQLSWRAPEDFLIGMMHRRWADAVRRQTADAHAGTPDAPCLGGRTPEALARTMKDYRLIIQGVADPRAAQVTRGGLCNDGFDPHTLESRQVPGLHASGEVLDVDGRCGGYNLHWAWASGLVAGAHAAQALPAT